MVIVSYPHRVRSGGLRFADARVDVRGADAVGLGLGQQLGHGGAVEGKFDFVNDLCGTNRTGFVINEHIYIHMVYI